MIFSSPLLQLLPNFRTQQIHHTSGNCRTICKSNEITWIENEGGRVKNRIVPFVVEHSGGNSEDGWGAAREKERKRGREREGERIRWGWNDKTRLCRLACAWKFSPPVAKQFPWKRSYGHGFRRINTACMRSRSTTGRQRSPLWQRATCRDCLPSWWLNFRNRDR